MIGGGGEGGLLIANANVITLPLKFCFDVLVKGIRYTCEIAARKKSLAQTMTSNSNATLHFTNRSYMTSFPSCGTLKIFGIMAAVGKFYSSELARTTVCFVYSLTLLN